MRTRDLRRQARRRLDGLSREHLVVADHVLAWLEDLESIEATEELLAIPGFLEEFQAACKEADEGKLTDFEEIDWEDEGADPSATRPSPPTAAGRSRSHNPPP